MQEPSEIKNCWNCKYKWKCYDRFMKGRTIPCNNPIEQQKNYKWFRLFAETPEDRKQARKIYAQLSNAECIKKY